MKKKAVTTSPFDTQKRSAISNADDSAKIKGMGIDCGKISEPLAEYVKADCEVVYPDGGHPNNAYIVFGRDRPGLVHEGYGGDGYTQCGMIDIVVGRMSPVPVAEFNYIKDEPASPVKVDPMLTPYLPLKHGLKEEDVPATWASDAARIYISQMTDIDKNFSLHDGQVGSSIGKSGIGIKADAIRIMGNEGVKIISNSDGTNSSGQKLTKKGIDLIANNDGRRDNAEYIRSGTQTLLGKGPSLQPLVKGENLQACIDEMLEEMIKMQSTLQGLVNQFIDANIKWGTHTHPPAIPFVDIFPSPVLIPGALDINMTLGTTTMLSLISHQDNLQNIKNKFLERTGKCFINSKYNNTN